jgi:hypothetical protein
MHANRTNATGSADDWARWVRWRAQRLRDQLPMDPQASPQLPALS